MKRVKKIGDSTDNRIMIRMNTDVLERIEKELGQQFVVQIGVLGEKAESRLKLGKVKVGKKSKTVTEGESPLTNAEIGLIHEKGSKSAGIPRRSFLEMPLTTKMPALMHRVGAALLEGVTKLNIRETYGKLGSIAEGVVLLAFKTTGFGSWPANKPSTIARKGSSRPLIDTAQLRQSIAHRVVAK